MQTEQWLLTAAVIIVPLIIAIVVTLWSLDQVRYRRKKRPPVANVARETGSSDPTGVNPPRSAHGDQN